MSNYNQIQQKRNKNIEIFQNTMYMCNNDEDLKKWIEYSREHQKILLEDYQFPNLPKKSDEPCKIIVSRERSLQAAQKYVNKGLSTAVLNFASATNPGGGVSRGSSAQEECLCRCSTLYKNIATESAVTQFYQPHKRAKNALYNNDCIYTPGVMVFKSDTNEPKVLDKKDWYSVDIITCAAPNLRENPGGSIMNPNKGEVAVSNISDEKLKQIHIERGRRILTIARMHMCPVVILGAFGCGAFKNPPKIVAEAYKELVEEFKYYFDTIEFAVYCPSYNDTNYRVFKNIIMKDYNTDQYIAQSNQNFVYGAMGYDENKEEK